MPPFFCPTKIVSCQFLASFRAVRIDLETRECVVRARVWRALFRLPRWITHATVSPVRHRAQIIPDKLVYQRDQVCFPFRGCDNAGTRLVLKYFSLADPARRTRSLRRRTRGRVARDSKCSRKSTVQFIGRSSPLVHPARAIAATSGCDKTLGEYERSSAGSRI